ncbi:MAG: DUF1566 domain-containing protein [Deltaproteobacteria bacterium]|nr:DUF1566 domain-containing protein [Deltaproteobacteria bacterium]
MAVLFLSTGLECKDPYGNDDDSDDDDGDDTAGDDDGGGDNDGGSDDDDSGIDDDEGAGDSNWQDPPSDEMMVWQEAVAYCKNLIFNGQDDWRLPTISELRSLIRGCDATELAGSCGVRDECTAIDCWDVSCNGCENGQGPALGGAYWPYGMSGEVESYWSSSPVAGYDYVWFVNFTDGRVEYLGSVYGYNYARCIRSPVD